MPGRASAASRCSVDRNSSPAERMICSAPVRMFAVARGTPGCATVLPLTLGIRARMASVLDFTIAGSAPTARSRPGAVEPWVASSAASRCAGSTEELPSEVAAVAAPFTTSRLLVVRFSRFTAGSAFLYGILLLTVSTAAGRRADGVDRCGAAEATKPTQRVCMVQRTKVECIPLKFACWADRAPQLDQPDLGSALDVSRPTTSAPTPSPCCRQSPIVDAVLPKCRRCGSG